MLRRNVDFDPENVILDIRLHWSLVAESSASTWINRMIINFTAAQQKFVCEADIVILFGYRKAIKQDWRTGHVHAVLFS